MKKSLLLNDIKKNNPNLKEEELEYLFDLFLSTVTDCLIEYGRLEIRNFGSFALKAKKEQDTTNLYVKFKASKFMNDQLNQ